MNAQLFDFMNDLGKSSSTDAAGEVFIRFAQGIGASVVHTFFGTDPDKQSVSTVPEDYAREDARLALLGDNHLANAIRAGNPRLIWGVDFEHMFKEPTKSGHASVMGRFENFRQRSSVTFAMPNTDGSFCGAGVGIGFEDTGPQFLKRMDESGGALAVAAFAAFAQMKILYKPQDQASPLSPRQQEILLLLADGYRLSQIADKLKISDSAVRLYLVNLRAKLGVKTKEQALALAIRNGWITP